MPDYTALPDGSRTFAVEIRYPNGGVQLTAGFKTEADAEQWIADRQREDAHVGCEADGARHTS
jgi:hypothetical protein